MTDKKGILDTERADKTTLGEFLNGLGKPGWVLLVLRVVIYIITKVIDFLNDDED